MKYLLLIGLFLASVGCCDHKTDNETIHVDGSYHITDNETDNETDNKTDNKTVHVGDCVIGKERFYARLYKVIEIGKYSLHLLDETGTDGVISGTTIDEGYLSKVDCFNKFDFLNKKKGK